MAFTICIKDRFGDVHAARVTGAATPEAIEMSAREIAETLAVCDDDEHIKVGLCQQRDPGAARLADGKDYGDGGIEWLYETQVSKLKKWLPNCPDCNASNNPDTGSCSRSCGL